jgi:hypothetical protein
MPMVFPDFLIVLCAFVVVPISVRQSETASHVEERADSIGHGAWRIGQRADGRRGHVRAN